MKSKAAFVPLQQLHGLHGSLTLAKHRSSSTYDRSFQTRWVTFSHVQRRACLSSTANNTPPVMSLVFKEKSETSNAVNSLSGKTTSTAGRTSTTVTTTPPKRKTDQPVIHVDGDSLENSPSQIALVLVAGFLATYTLGQNLLVSVLGLGVGVGGGVVGVDPVAAIQFLVSALIGYLFADFASGIYHWALDNYGSKDTPVFGFQIAGFQGHHTSPWTITKRPFFNNVSKACVPALPQLLVLALVHLPMPIEVFYVTSLALFILAQEFHKWSHMTEPPQGAVTLMDLGLTVSRKVHGKHHKDPFEGNYCIISGIWNPLLDRIKFFRYLELFFYKVSGAQPICWKLDPKLKADLSVDVKQI